MKWFNWTRKHKRDAGGTTAPSALSYIPERFAGFGAFSTEQSLRVGTVYACVSLISESVASLPLMYKRKKGAIFTEFSASPLNYLFRIQPNDHSSAFDFWRLVVQQVLLDGNAYIVPRYDAVTYEITALELCAQHTVTYDAGASTYTVTDTLNGIFGTFREDEIIHIKGMSTDGRLGVSVIRYASNTLTAATEGERETLNRFHNGGAIKGLVTNETASYGVGEYSDTELDKKAQEMDSLLARGVNIIGVPGKVEFKQISQSSADMQFLESRKFTVSDICRFFRVPPSFIYHDTATNYKSAEAANVAFLNNSLNPWLRRIENELTRKLIPRGQAFSRLIEFDRSKFFESDLSTKVAYQEKLLQTGLRTVNELRIADNQPPVEGGDAVLVSANLRDITTPPAGAATEGGKKEDNKDKENTEDETEENADTQP